MKESLVCPGRWERLLVCTDGSPHSQAAVAAALALGRACAAKVYALEVLQIIPEFEAVAPDLRGRLEEEVRVHLAAIKTEAAGLGVSLETLSRHSLSPFSAILEVAEQVKPEVILMGRYGRTGLARLLMGSVTARVIGLSPVKVLVIPLQATLAFRRLLVASDGSPYSAAAWDEALAITRAAGSELLAISVARDEGEIVQAEENLHQLILAANREGVPLQGLVPQGQEADDAIVQAALEQGVDLILMGSHGRTGLIRLLMGSVTERVIGQTPCPVLVVKKK